MLQFVHVAGKENPADALTKPASKGSLQCLLEAGKMRPVHRQPPGAADKDDFGAVT